MKLFMSWTNEATEGTGTDSSLETRGHMRSIIPSMKFNLEPFWTQWAHTLPDLTLWSKEGMWCDRWVWLHSAQLQQWHQDYSRQCRGQRSGDCNTSWEGGQVVVLGGGGVDSPPGNIMRALCSIWSAFCLCLLLSSQSASYCWLRLKWQSAVEKAKLGSWDKFLCSCQDKNTKAELIGSGWAAVTGRWSGAAQRLSPPSPGTTAAGAGTLWSAASGSPPAGACREDPSLDPDWEEAGAVISNVAKFRQQSSGRDGRLYVS